LGTIRSMLGNTVATIENEYRIFLIFIRNSLFAGTGYGFLVERFNKQK